MLRNGTLVPFIFLGILAFCCQHLETISQGASVLSTATL